MDKVSIDFANGPVDTLIFETIKSLSSANLHPDGWSYFNRDLGRVGVLEVDTQIIIFDIDNLTPEEGGGSDPLRRSGITTIELLKGECIEAIEVTGPGNLHLENLDNGEGCLQYIFVTDTFTGELTLGSAFDGIPVIQVTPIFNVTQGTYHDTIQDAIDAAAFGDTIEVGPGTYEENIELTVDNLTLRSNPGAEIQGDTIQFMADNVTLEGFIIDNLGGARAIAPRNSSGATIKDNVIRNSMRGIQGDVGGRPTDLTIVGNTFEESIQYGIAGTEDVDFLIVSGNTFKTTVEGIGIGEGAGIPKENLPDVMGDQIWDLNGGYAIMDYRAIRDTTVYVAKGGSIQDGIDAADAGDIVEVYPGLYREQVTIDKDLTLLGYEMDQPVVQAYVSMEPCFVTSANNVPVICVIDADVDIENIIIDGAGKGNSNERFMGLAFRNAGGSLLNSTVTGVRNETLSGAQHGVAVYAYNTDGITRSIRLHNNIVADFQKNAVALNADDTTPIEIDVHGNTIIGAGATDVTAQNAIQVWAAEADGWISNNTISGIGYSGDRWVASSILVMDNVFGTVYIENNTITAAQMGIYLYDGKGLIAGNNIEVQRMGEYSFGIIASDPPTAPPQPFGEEDNLVVTSQDIGILAVLPVTIMGNEITLVEPPLPASNFSGAAKTWGILVEGGWTRYDINLFIADNIITGFDYGVDFNQVDHQTGKIRQVDAVHNCIIDSAVYGMRSNADEIWIYASRNFWGDATGPFHPTENPDGLGGEVSDYIWFDLWLDACPLKEEPKAPFEYFLPLFMNE